MKKTVLSLQGKLTLSGHGQTIEVLLPSGAALTVSATRAMDLAQSVTATGSLWRCTFTRPARYRLARLLRRLAVPDTVEVHSEPIVGPVSVKVTYRGLTGEDHHAFMDGAANATVRAWRHLFRPDPGVFPADARCTLDPAERREEARIIRELRQAGQDVSLSAEALFRDVTRELWLALQGLTPTH